MINLLPLKLRLPRLDFDHRLRDLRKSIDRRALTAAIERLHIAAVEHECNGVERGDQIFSRLYNQARIYCDQFRRDWGGDVSELHVYLPSLEHLRRLAQAQPLEQ
jgi:hypothetical protein